MKLSSSVVGSDRLIVQIRQAIIGSAGLRIIGMGFGFLVGVQLARGLGAEGYGVYGLAMALIALLSVPVEFGLPQLVTREVAVARVEEDWGKLSGMLRWATRASFLIALLVSGCVILGMLVSGPGFSTELGLTLLAGLVMVPLVAQSKIYGAVLLGFQKIVRGQAPDVLIRPMFFSGLLFLVSFFFGSFGPIVAMLLGAAAATMSLLVAAGLLRQESAGRLGSVEPMSGARHWWSSAIPMALTEGMRVLQGHLVILLLGIITPVAMVGVYKVASSVSLMIAVPVTLFNVVNAPIIARLYRENNHQRLQKLMAVTALAMTVGTLLLISPFFFAGEWILTTVFGVDFIQSNSILLLLFIGVLANGIFGSNAVLLNMTGHETRVTRASVVSLGILACFSPVLIYYRGIEGAAVASVLSTIVWNVLMWRDGKRLLSIDSGVTALARWGFEK